MTEVDISQFDWSTLLWWLAISAIFVISTVLAHITVKNKVQGIHKEYALDSHDRSNTPKETTKAAIVTACVISVIGFFVAIGAGSISDEEQLRQSLHQATNEQISVIGVPQKSFSEALFGSYSDEPEIDYTYDDNTQFTFDAIVLPDQKKLSCKISNTSGKHLIGCVKNNTREYVSVQEAIDAATRAGDKK